MLRFKRYILSNQGPITLEMHAVRLVHICVWNLLLYLTRLHCTMKFIINWLRSNRGTLSLFCNTIARPYLRYRKCHIPLLCNCHAEASETRQPHLLECHQTSWKSYLCSMPNLEIEDHETCQSLCCCFSEPLSHSRGGQSVFDSFNSR